MTKADMKAICEFSGADKAFAIYFDNAGREVITGSTIDSLFPIPDNDELMRFEHVDMSNHKYYIWKHIETVQGMFMAEIATDIPKMDARYILM